MDLLLTLIILIIISVISISIVASLIAYYQAKVYQNLQNNIAAIQIIYEHSIKKLKKYEPYLHVHINIPEFKNIELMIFQNFKALKDSAHQVSIILKYLPPISQIEFNFSFLLLHKSWKVINKIREARQNILDAELESFSWNYLIDDLDKQIRELIGIKQIIVKRVVQSKECINDIKRDLQKLEDEGTKELNECREMIEDYDQEIIDLERKLEKVPDVIQPDESIILKYCSSINRLYSSLTKIESQCSHKKNYLQSIGNNKNSCEANLRHLKDCTKNIHDCLKRLRKAGLKMDDFYFQAEEFENKIVDAEVKFSKKTPAIYASLCAILPNIKEEQKIIEEQLSDIEKEFGSANENVEKLKQSIQQEVHQITQNGQKQVLFDLSIEKVKQAKLLLNKAFSLVSIPELDILKSIGSIVDEGFELIDQSTNLRLEFNENLIKLKNLIESYYSDLKPQIIRAIEIIKGLIEFRHDFSCGISRRPREWKCLIASASRDFRRNCNIDFDNTSQSDLQNIYHQILESKKKFDSRLVEIKQLEDILIGYKKYKSIIEDQYKQMYSLWKQVIRLSRSSPLILWLEKFNNIELNKNKWKREWHYKIGSSFIHLSCELKKLIQDSTKLIELFEEHRKELEEKINNKFTKLNTDWQWLEEKLNSKPRPSVDLSKLRDKFPDFQEKFNRIKQKPMEMDNLYEKLNNFLKTVSEMKIKVQDEAKDYEKIQEECLNRVRKAQNLFTIMIEDFNEKIVPNRWTDDDYDDHKCFNEIQKNLNEQEKFYYDVVDFKNNQSVDKIINRLDKIKEAFSLIISQIEEIKKKINERYNRKNALVETISVLHEQVYIQLINSKQEEYTKLEHHYQRIKKLVEKASKSNTFLGYEELLKSAIQLASTIVPDASKYINAGIYNEGTNRGFQSGRDLYAN